MIRTRALQLCKARSLIPGLPKRSFASEAQADAVPSNDDTPPTEPTLSNSTINAIRIIREQPIKREIRNRSRRYKRNVAERSVQLTPDSEKEAEESGKKKPSWQDFQGTTPQTPSKVYWALSDIYEVGGMIPRAASMYHQTGERGMPLWGEWGIPLKIREFGGASIFMIPSFWLRDNCRCSQCVNPDTMQRALETFSIPQNILPSEVVTEDAGLSIKWGNDSHASLYPWDWIMKHRTQFSPLLDKENVPIQKDDPDPRHVYWGAEIEAEPPSVQYDEIMADDNGVGAWTDKIRKYGFCYVDGCPVDPKKTEELLERISFVRVTHYGGFYDFTSDLTMKDTAYTTLALPAHTDNTYFTDPAGLQMFHLLSHTDGEGGASLLVDGFHAASVLKAECHHSHTALSRTPITWHASGNEGITITPAKKFPVFNYGDAKDGDEPRLQQVRWNNDDRGVVALRENGGMGAEKWYNAARKWDETLRRKDMQYWAQLKPGRPLIFDNWRVLHGRSVFTGKRRMCGGYINHDDYISRWRNTNFTREEALKQIL
ncbi:Trimethyllysine dioxygenase [Lachnellula suecica]|uniref:Trimethyllysine dioxygenase n=1 Tax=Lachnellula suecica TaxID=602035 RepID=A0A8T9C8R1_9HELO|nr:Trimethyllysine dioxygenase [Lachnellula suecica]